MSKRKSKRINKLLETAIKKDEKKNKKIKVKQIIDHEDHSPITFDSAEDIPNLSNEQIIEMLNEIMSDDNKKLSPFERYLKERHSMLSGMTNEDRKKIENEIKYKILKIFKQRKGGYFKYEDFIAIDSLTKHFPILTTSGDRNIGKTTSSKRLIRNVVHEKERFILLRNNQEEIKAQIKSDKETFLVPNGWSASNQKTPDISDIDGNIVGYYRDINTIGKMKSIEFPNVSLIVVEEFSTRVRISDKFSKFVEFITTAQRHREKLNIILQANYVDQDDEILQKLGVGLEEMAEIDFVKFNWITGAIMIFIPFGIYKSTSDDIEKKKKYLGNRLSLNDFETWLSQYGGGFKQSEYVNVINMNDMVTVKPVFNIYYETVGQTIRKITLYNCVDKQENFYQVLMTQLEVNNMPIFVFDNRVKIRYPHAINLEYDKLLVMLDAWNNKKLKTSDSKTFDAIIYMFSKAKDILDKEEELREIKELF